jgi:RNA polymerase sigma factor (sigma-70 family)
VVHDARVEAGTRSTVEDVYREQAARLWRALVAFTSDREVANDAVAEAFAQLLARGSSVRDPAAWVWRAAFKISVGELATRRLGAPASDAFPDSTASSDVAIDLMRALQMLPPQQRAVVVLRHLADLPTARVSRILGISPPTVRVHLMNARRRLRKTLEVIDE